MKCLNIYNSLEKFVTAKKMSDKDKEETEKRNDEGLDEQNQNHLDKNNENIPTRTDKTLNAVDGLLGIYIYIFFFP